MYFREVLIHIKCRKKCCLNWLITTILVSVIWFHMRHCQHGLKFLNENALNSMSPFSLSKWFLVCPNSETGHPLPTLGGQLYHIYITSQYLKWMNELYNLFISKIKDDLHNLIAPYFLSRSSFFFILTTARWNWRYPIMINIKCFTDNNIVLDKYYENVHHTAKLV